MKLYKIMNQQDTIELMTTVVNELNTLDKELVRVELYKRVHNQGFKAINVAYSIVWDIFLHYHNK